MIVARAVERARRRLAETARRLRLVAIEHELRRLVVFARAREDLAPRLLRVVEDERGEVLLALLLEGRARRFGDAGLVVAAKGEHAADDRQTSREHASDDDRAAEQRPPASPLGATIDQFGDS